MTASASSDGPPRSRFLGTGASPATIRAALFPEDRELFDQDYEQALDDAWRTYELTLLHDTVESWRRRAIAQSDPEAFRRMVRRAAEFFSGEPIADDEPFAVTRAKAGM
jgi:hypothetical protein